LRESNLARIVVTGAAGFIGGAVCRGLAARGQDVLGLARGQADPIPGVDPGVELRAAGAIDADTDWPRHLAGVEIVIHAAGRAHGHLTAAARAAEPVAAAALARAAAAAGVRRLVHISSLKAMGEATLPGRPFRETDPALPQDAYGQMKRATEEALSAAADGALEIVILRPPLVYGPGVKANFRALLRLVASGMPLPLAGIDNRRSLIFLDNLVDLAARAATHPAAAGRILLARDGEDLSTPALIRMLAAGLGRPARLFAVPGPVFAVAHHLPGVGPPAARLTLSLRVDDASTRAALAWTPPVPAPAGLALTARAFLRENQGGGAAFSR
jgi:nucleoside-diphosphate-sugar epimerase